MVKNTSLIFTAIILFSGCSYSSVNKVNKKCNPLGLNKSSCVDEKKEHVNPSIFFTKEVRQDEIVDYGQYAEIWIAPYKDKIGTLFNSRTMNIWITKPDFIIGEQLSYSTGGKSLRDNVKKSNFNINKFQFNTSNEKKLKIELDENVKKFLEE